MATIASFPDPSLLFKKMTSKGLAGLVWTYARPVPVLTVVNEDMLVREVALDADLVLGEMLGGRPLGRVLVNLLGVDMELGRFGFILSRDSPVDVEPLL
jgi:hypothetical protein